MQPIELAAMRLGMRCVWSRIALWQCSCGCWRTTSNMTSQNEQLLHSW